MHSQPISIKTEWNLKKQKGFLVIDIMLEFIYKHWKEHRHSSQDEDVSGANGSQEKMLQGCSNAPLISLGEMASVIVFSI